MKISNFKLVDVIGGGPTTWKFKAVVDVSRVFRKKETVEVFREYGESWYFIETGKFTPGDQVEDLVRKLEAEKGKRLEGCLNV